MRAYVFNRNTKLSNLSSEEGRRKKQALRQLCGTSFCTKCDKDLPSMNQQIVKSTNNDLIVKQELPTTAPCLIITTSCIYFLPKILKPNNPSQPIISACSCPTELISS